MPRNSETPQGSMNAHRLVRKFPFFRLFIERFPQENQTTIDQIDDEFTKVGFFAAGGNYKIRSPQEQFNFMQHAANVGLRVLIPSNIKGERLYLPYYENAQTIDVFIQASSFTDITRVVDEAMEDLHEAHSHNIVYGDRWAKNILVLEKRGIYTRKTASILNVDFDLDIAQGDLQVAKNFEVAQLTYYVIHSIFNRKTNEFDWENFLTNLTKTINRSDWVNLSRVASFVIQEASYLSETYPESYSTEIIPIAERFANMLKMAN